MKNTDLQVLFNENLVQSILEFSKELIVNRTVTKHLHDMAKIQEDLKKEKGSISIIIKCRNWNYKLIKHLHFARQKKKNFLYRIVTVGIKNGHILIIPNEKNHMLIQAN